MHCVRNTFYWFDIVFVQYFWCILQKRFQTTPIICYEMFSPSACTNFNQILCAEFYQICHTFQFWLLSDGKSGHIAWRRTITDKVSFFSLSEFRCCRAVWTDPSASSAVVVIATRCSCFIENKLAGICRCWGVVFIADIYEFLEPNRHFALKMSYVLHCVYGPHRCEMRRWLLLDSIQSRRLPQSLRIISGCTVACAPKCWQPEPTVRFITAELPRL
jgi:hypothetical protein